MAEKRKTLEEKEAHSVDVRRMNEVQEKQRIDQILEKRDEKDQVMAKT